MMEAIWVAAEMRAGAAYAHSTLMLATLAEEEGRERRVDLHDDRGSHQAGVIIASWAFGDKARSLGSNEINSRRDLSRSGDRPTIGPVAA